MRSTIEPNQQGVFTALRRLRVNWCPLTMAIEEVHNAPHSRSNQPKKAKETLCLPSQDRFREKSRTRWDFHLTTNPITNSASARLTAFSTRSIRCGTTQKLHTGALTT